jgi:hypothetical protein
VRMEDNINLRTEGIEPACSIVPPPPPTTHTPSTCYRIKTKYAFTGVYPGELCTRTSISLLRGLMLFVELLKFCLLKRVGLLTQVINPVWKQLCICKRDGVLWPVLMTVSASLRYWHKNNISQMTATEGRLNAMPNVHI